MADVSKIKILIGNTQEEYNFKDSTARSGLENKVDKVTGKGLSTNDYTTDEKNKLAEIYTKTEIDNIISSVYKPSGSILFTNLPELSATVLGNVYDVTNDFITDNRFVEGTGHHIEANTNVVVVNTGTSENPVYKFDVLSGFIDFSGYQEKNLNSTITVNGEQQTTVEGAISAINNFADLNKNRIDDMTKIESVKCKPEISQQDEFAPVNFLYSPFVGEGRFVWTDEDNIYYSYNNNQYILDKATSAWLFKTWNGLTSFQGHLIWTDGNNIYYSNGNTQYVLDKSTSTWSEKTWNGLTSFNAPNIWIDGDNVYYSYETSQYILDKNTSTWSEKTWNGLTSFNGSNIWSDGDNIYYSYGTSQYVLDKSTSTWLEKNWIGLTDFDRSDIWTDGDNIYYSNNSSQYILDKVTSTWTTETWKGLTNFSGEYIWTDGDNIYYSDPGAPYILINSKKEWIRKTWTKQINDIFGNLVWTDNEHVYYSSATVQYVLVKDTLTWIKKQWNGLISFYGNYIWTDGNNIYYSLSSAQYILDKTTSTWSEKTWNGLTNFSGNSIWTDGNNIYCSYGTSQYVLDKATSTWSTKTWSGLTNFSGNSIWTDGDNIYYSSSRNQYVLNKATSTWTTKTWKGLTNFSIEYIWTDGDNIYCSNGLYQYVLDKTTSTWSEKTWNGLISFYGGYIWKDGNNMYYSLNGVNYILNKTTNYLPEMMSSTITVDNVPRSTVEGAISAVNVLANNNKTNISELSSEKQSKTLSSAITVNGTAQNTVEDTLNALNNEIQTPVPANAVFTDTNNRRSFFGTCDTAADVSAKVVTLSNTDGWELVPGVIVGVKYTNTANVGNVTLDVNGTGDKSIWYNTAVYTATNSSITGTAGQITYYMYDGAYWTWIHNGKLSDTDTKVTQTHATDDNNYSILFSSTANTSTKKTEDSKKNTSFYFNPSTGNLQVPKINGVTVGDNPKFTDTTYTTATTSADGLMSSSDKNKLDNNIYTKTEIDNIISSVYKPAGSILFTNLPELSATVLGNVYDVTNDFITDSRFVKGTGHHIEANTNVVVVNTGTSENPVYKFDVLSGFIDFSGYQEKNLNSTITVNGEQQTTVEGAISAINNYTSAKISDIYAILESYGGDTLPKYINGYSGFINVNRNNSNNMYSKLYDLPFIINTNEDITLEFCMKVLSGRTHAGRYLDFDNGTFVIADEYSDGHYYLEIKCGGEWRLTESDHIEIPQDVNFTLSVVISAENTQIFIQKENGDSDFYAYRWLDSSMLDDLTSGDTYFFDSTESNSHVDGKLYAFRKYRRALTIQEITVNHLEDMRLAAMANRLEIIKQPEDVSAVIGETIKLQTEAIGENIRYQWKYKDTEIDTSTINFNNGTNATLVKVVDENYAGIIAKCLITDNSQNVLTSDSVKVSLKSNPNGIEIIDQPDNIITSLGETITLSVVAVGESLSYKWRYRNPYENYWYDFRNGNFSSIQKIIDSDYSNVLVHCVVTDVNQNVAISDSIRIIVQEDDNRKSETKLESKGKKYL